jgi:hypothetical protein
MRNKNRKLRRNWKIDANPRKRTAATSGFYNGVQFFYSAFISSPANSSRFFMEYVYILRWTTGKAVHS